MLKRRIRQYEEIPDDELWFLDRGIPDLIAYIRKDGLEVPDMYFEATKQYRYQSLIFLTPPWKEIHKNDRERLESFAQAKNIHEEIERTYTEIGYTCINLPKATISERVAFILDSIAS